MCLLLIQVKVTAWYCSFSSVRLSVWGRLYRRLVWLSAECLGHFLRDFASCPPCFRWTLPSEQMLISCFPVLDESFFSCFQEFLFQQSDYILRHDFVIYFRAYDCADGYINEVWWASKLLFTPKANSISHLLSWRFCLISFKYVIPTGQSTLTCTELLFLLPAQIRCELHLWTLHA